MHLVGIAVDFEQAAQWLEHVPRRITDITVRARQPSHAAVLKVNDPAESAVGAATPFRDDIMPGEIRRLRVVACGTSAPAGWTDPPVRGDRQRAAPDRLRRPGFAPVHVPRTRTAPEQQRWKAASEPARSSLDNVIQILSRR